MASLALAIGGLSPASAAEPPDSAPSAPSALKLRLSEPGAGVTLSVRVAGAVSRPGVAMISPLAATLDGLLARAGDVLPEGYRFGTLVLRAASAGAAVSSDGPAVCLPPADFHALLLLGDDPALSLDADTTAAIRQRRLARATAPTLVRGSLGAAEWPKLQDGDIVAVPQRTPLVYVAAADGRVARLQHESSVLADEYLDRADLGGSGAKHVLLYPDGRPIELSLDAWRYRPTMVPPGSLIAPAVGCLPVE